VSAQSPSRAAPQAPALDPARPHRGVPPGDDGFTLTEVVVAVVLLAAVLASAGGIVVSGVVTSAGLQRRDTAVQLADEAMDLVRAVPPAADQDGSVPLLEGRGQAAVQAHWAGGPPELATTDPAWDDDPSGAPLVPLTVTRSAGGLDYLVDTYIGSCRLARDAPPGTACANGAGGGIEYFRVVVRVTWTEGAGTSCSAGACEYLLATLLNGDAEPLFNPDAEVPDPVAVDDAFTVQSGVATVLPVVANDTGGIAAVPITVVSPPAHGTLTNLENTGEVTYTATAGYGGTDSFTYRLTGTIGAVSGTATVVLTVENPIVVDDVAATTYPQPVTVDVRANDTGVYRTGTISVTQPASGGTAAVAGDQVVVTPTVSFPAGSAAPTGANLVTNGDFENAPGAVANARTALATLPGWTRSGGSGALFEVLNGVDGGAPQGVHMVEIDTTRNITMSQTVSTVAGQRYRLSFQVSPDTRRDQTSNGLQVLFGGTTVADIRYDGTGSGVWWTTYTVDVVATGASSTLAFTGTGSSDGIGIDLDDVRLTALTDDPARLSATNWTISVPYLNTGPSSSAAGTVLVTASPPAAAQASDRTVCLVRARNSRVTFDLADSVSSGVTTNAIYTRTSTPSTTYVNTPVGPLAGDARGRVTVDTRGRTGTGSTSFTWQLRDAWNRTSTATVTLQVANSC
jgi:prepilin-type N-terminal cleavage/methylation domain-containing protein